MISCHERRKEARILSNSEFCTIPLDTAKVRLQLQKKVPLGDSEAAPKYRGLLGTVAIIARKEGLFALWKGIISGLHRQCIYEGLRIGLYETVKTFIVGSNYSGDVPLFHKILATLLTGAIAIAVTNPTDLVKIRLQDEGKMPAGVVRRYSGAFHAYYAIVKHEGVAALWTGLGPNIARNAIINVVELASYDHVKEVAPKRWRLEVNSSQDAVLMLSSLNLPDGIHVCCLVRRRSVAKA